MCKSTPVIGLIGGIGSGKSSVAHQLAKQLDIKIIDGDEIGHQVLKRPDVISQLVEEFGDSLLNEKGEIDRRKLARIVFSDDDNSQDSLNKLEKIVHPLIEGTIDSEIRQSKEHDAIILDAAVMFEAGWNRFCDKIIFVDVPEALRFQRIAQSRNWSKQQWQDREARQLTIQEKQERADIIIDNSLSIEHAAKQLKNHIDNYSKTKL